MTARRKKGVQLILPIVYGNETIKLPDDAPESKLGHTHRWTVYLRGANNEDISYYVKKVVIRLHESFENAARTLEKWPYEVSETGWGEFGILTSIYLNDFGEKPLKLSHMLRLFPPDEQPNVPIDPGRAHMLVDERYDELVVNEPSEQFYEVVLSNLEKSWPLISPVWNRKTEMAELQRLERANDEVVKQIEEYRKHMQERDQQLINLKEESISNVK